MEKFLLLATLFLFSAVVKAESDFTFFPHQAIASFLQMSPADKFKTIQNADIEVYKFITESPVTSDAYAAQLLELVPEVQSDQFRQFRSTMKSDVLGFFLSHKIPEYEVEKDTLLLSHEADTWTLAHELSHALIDKERENTLNFARLGDAKEDYEESMRSYRMNGKFLSDNHVRSTFSAIKTWTTMQIEILYVFDLEEVKIERALGHFYRNNPEMNLNKETYARSNWYMKRNCDSAVNKAQLAVEVVDYFETLVPQNLIAEINKELSTLKSDLKTHNKSINDYCLN